MEKTFRLAVIIPLVSARSEKPLNWSVHFEEERTFHFPTVGIEPSDKRAYCIEGTIFDQKYEAWFGLSTLATAPDGAVITARTEPLKFSRKKGSEGQTLVVNLPKMAPPIVNVEMREQPPQPPPVVNVENYIETPPRRVEFKRNPAGKLTGATVEDDRV